MRMHTHMHTHTHMLHLLPEHPSSPQIPLHGAEATPSVVGLQGVAFFQVVVQGLHVGGLEVTEIARQQVGGRVEFQVPLQLVRSVESFVAHLPDSFPLLD